MPADSAASLLRGVGAAAQEVRKRWGEGVGREGTALGGGDFWGGVGAWVVKIFSR